MSINMSNANTSQQSYVPYATGIDYHNTIKLSHKRNSFTMIELVFSLVIVGFVILSIPLIIRQSDINTAMSQNVIGYYNALSLLDTIRSKPWDTNNVSDFVSSGEYYILNTDNQNTNCKKISAISDNQTITTQLYSKNGLSLANKRRTCDPDNKYASKITINTNKNKLESINDFNGYEALVYSNVSNNRAIFKLKVAVEYVNINTIADTFNIVRANGTNDIKQVRITLIRMLDNAEVDTQGEAVFTYYAANIGTDAPLVKDNNIVQATN